MTNNSHNVVMLSVGIAELKSRLSHYLRYVRRGRTLVVLDHGTPVARIVAYTGENPPLPVRRSRTDSPKIGDVPLPPPLKAGGDIVKLLIQERQTDR
jgi:prevent-host-death family protein